MSNCTKMRIDNLNTSDVTDMSFMFAGCLSVESLDVSDFDTAKITSMDHMFYNSGISTITVGENFTD